jgi:hypothetical protein
MCVCGYTLVNSTLNLGKVSFSKPCIFPLARFQTPDTPTRPYIREDAKAQSTSSQAIRYLLPEKTATINLI